MGATRLCHGYGITRGVLETGSTGTGRVLKIPTRVVTVPLTAVSRVVTVFNNRYNI
jgi:hypothetical protein